MVASKFFIFLAFMILCSLAATSLALAVSAVARTTDMAVTVLPMALEVREPRPPARAVHGNPAASRSSGDTHAAHRPAVPCTAALGCPGLS